MTNLAQPWSSYSFLQTTLLDGTYTGLDQDAAAKAIDLIAPLMLGGLCWEIIVTDLSPFISTCFDWISRRHHLGKQTKYGDPLSISVAILSFFARLSALALLCVYIAFTQGSQARNCSIWPHTLASLGAVVSILVVYGCPLLSPPSHRHPPFLNRPFPLPPAPSYFGEYKLS